MPPPNMPMMPPGMPPGPGGAMPPPPGAMPPPPGAMPPPPGAAMPPGAPPVAPPPAEPPIDAAHANWRKILTERIRRLSAEDRDVLHNEMSPAFHRVLGKVLGKAMPVIEDELALAEPPGVDEGTMRAEGIAERQMIDDRRKGRPRAV